MKILLVCAVLQLFAFAEQTDMSKSKNKTINEKQETSQKSRENNTDFKKGQQPSVKFKSQSYPRGAIATH